MGFYGRFSGVGALSIYRAFGSDADAAAEVVAVHTNDTTLSVTVYENAGMKSLIASDDGNLTLREWDEKPKPTVLTTVVSANGEITRTLEDHNRRFRGQRQLRVPASSAGPIRQDIRDLAVAVLPLARYLVTSYHFRNLRKPPIDLHKIIAG